MALERGPLALQKSDALGWAEVDYGFGDFVITEWSEIDSITAELDATLPDLVDFAGEPDNFMDDVDLLALETLIFSYAAASPYGFPLDQIDLGISNADAGIGAAFDAAPAQAWVNAGAPYTPPTTGLVLAPVEVNQGAFTGTGSSGSSSSGSGSGSPPSVPLSVSLVNLDRYGSQNFVVGDHWQLIANGPVGAAVTATASVNGNAIGSSTVGSIPANGVLTVTGQFAPGEEGAWSEDWTIGGQAVATVSFIVSPA